MKYIYNIEKTKDYTEKIDFEEKIGKKYRKKDRKYNKSHKRA